MGEAAPALLALLQAKLRQREIDAVGNTLKLEQEKFKQKTLLEGQAEERTQAEFARTQFMQNQAATESKTIDALSKLISDAEGKNLDADGNPTPFSEERRSAINKLLEQSLGRQLRQGGITAAGAQTAMPGGINEILLQQRVAGKTVPTADVSAGLAQTDKHFQQGFNAQKDVRIVSLMQQTFADFPGLSGIELDFSNATTLEEIYDVLVTAARKNGINHTGQNQIIFEATKQLIEMRRQDIMAAIERGRARVQALMSTAPAQAAALKAQLDFAISVMERGDAKFKIMAEAEDIPDDVRALGLEMLRVNYQGALNLLLGRRVDGGLELTGAGGPPLLNFGPERGLFGGETDRPGTVYSQEDFSRLERTQPETLLNIITPILLADKPLAKEYSAQETPKERKSEIRKIAWDRFLIQQGDPRQGPGFFSGGLASPTGGAGVGAAAPVPDQSSGGASPISAVRPALAGLAGVSAPGAPLGQLAGAGAPAAAPAAPPQVVPPIPPTTAPIVGADGLPVPPGSPILQPAGGGAPSVTGGAQPIDARFGPGIDINFLLRAGAGDTPGSPATSASIGPSPVGATTPANGEELIQQLLAQHFAPVQRTPRAGGGGVGAALSQLGGEIVGGPKALFDAIAPKVRSALTGVPINPLPPRIPSAPTPVGDDAVGRERDNNMKVIDEYMLTTVLPALGTSSTGIRQYRGAATAVRRKIALGMIQQYDLLQRQQGASDGFELDPSGGEQLPVQGL